MLFVLGLSEDHPDRTYNATQGERLRYRGHFILKWKNPTNPGNMSMHENFRDAVRQGYTNIPPQERTQERPIVLHLRSQLRDEHQQWSQLCWFIRGRRCRHRHRHRQQHGGIRHTENSPQLWREWQQNEWQDQRWWEKW